MGDRPGFFSRIMQALTGGASAQAPSQEELRALFVARSQAFTRLLEANNKALEIMSDLEEALKGSHIFGMSFVRAGATAVGVNVFKLVRALSELEPGRFDALFARLAAIQAGIDEILTREAPRHASPFVLRFDEIDRHAADFAGGKMANLADMRTSLGLPVPDGFVVTASGYEAFMAAGDLQAEINARLQGLPDASGGGGGESSSGASDALAARFEASADIQARIMAAAVPPELANAITDAYERLRADTETEGGAPLRVSMRAVISTNGTLITKEKARELKSVGLSYVGISLDGGEEVHDHFRKVPGSFKKALEGVANCQAEGLKVGLRFTISKRNQAEVPKLFEIIRDIEVPRICFYHLVYSGRGSELIKEDLDHAETRAVVNLIMDETRKLFDQGKPKEVLTVDNHADGPLVYYRLLKEDPKRAAEVMELLQMNEGNSTGRGIGCISWDGKVHADQFWRQHVFGNVLERPFSQIWDDPEIELLHKLKDKKPYVKGRCAECRFLNICGGNFRARAEAYYGDIWAQDPACYLTDEEIKKD